MVTRRRMLMIGAAGLAAMTGLLFTAQARQSKPAAPASQIGRLPLDAHRALGKPHTYRNLTLIPVYDSNARAADAFVTLDEGMKSKQVSVKESKEGGDVNTLYVTNDSKKPLYLMGGEVVLGGQQDRCLARDTILPPGQHDVPITVFCVEHGRWTGHREFDDSAPTVASKDIRARAQEGEFYAAREASNPNGAVGGRAAPNAAASGAPGTPAASSGQANRRVAEVPADAPVRASGSNRVSDAQQQVWDKVAEKNAKLKTQSSTGTYRNALTLKSGDAQKSVPAYLKALSDSLGVDSHLVGVVAAINGKVVAADIFSDPTLFRKLWPKLLRSYASDAVENTPSDSKPIQVVTAKDAKGFLVTATDAKSKIENKSDVSSTVRYESSQAVTYSLVPGAKVGGTQGGFGGGGFGGGAVHTGVIGK